MRILITGDKGFVGSATKEYINGIRRSQQTGVTKHFDQWSQDEKETEYLDPIHEVVGYDLMDGCDIRDINQLDETAKELKPDRILHLAAIARFSEADANPLLAHETNVLGTMNVAKVASKYHIPVVYASTGSVYMPIEEDPPITEEFLARGNSQYGCTKLLGEKYIEQTTHIILRYAHLYGREKRFHGLVGGLLNRIERGLKPTLYNGVQSNDFCYIRDIARANLLALTAPYDAWNECYNIGTGQELSADEAAKLIFKVFDYKGEVERGPGRTVDPLRFVYNTDKAKNYLGFEVEYSFEQGLQDMIKDS